MLCCLAGRQIGADYTQLSRRDDERAKTPDMRWRGDEFKPIHAEFRLTAKVAYDYTKRPEVRHCDRCARRRRRRSRVPYSVGHSAGSSVVAWRADEANAITRRLRG